MPHAPHVPVPPSIDIKDKLRLAFWAWLDRWRYRKVDDGAHTHLTLRLQAQYADGCAAVDEWRVAEDARLRRSIVELGGPQTGGATTNTAHRPVEELAGLSRGERHRWAEENREADRRLRSAADAHARQAHAASAVRAWEADLSALPVIAEAAKERWRTHLVERQAIYTRARLRGFSGAQSAPARIPEAVVGDQAEPIHLRVA